jgi:hypothetical protein
MRTFTVQSVVTVTIFRAQTVKILPIVNVTGTKHFNFNGKLTVNIGTSFHNRCGLPVFFKKLHLNTKQVCRYIIIILNGGCFS